jgi:hypothetical protein
MHFILTLRAYFHIQGDIIMGAASLLSGRFTATCGLWELILEHGSSYDDFTSLHSRLDLSISKTHPA